MAKEKEDLKEGGRGRRFVVSGILVVFSHIQKCWDDRFITMTVKSLCTLI